MSISGITQGYPSYAGIRGLQSARGSVWQRGVWALHCGKPLEATKCLSYHTTEAFPGTIEDIPVDWLWWWDILQTRAVEQTIQLIFYTVIQIYIYVVNINICAITCIFKKIYKYFLFLWSLLFLFFIYYRYHYHYYITILYMYIYIYFIYIITFYYY